MTLPRVAALDSKVVVHVAGGEVRSLGEVAVHTPGGMLAALLAARRRRRTPRS